MFFDVMVFHKFWVDFHDFFIFMVYHGFWLVFIGFQGNFMRFLGFFMAFHCFKFMDGWRLHDR